MLKRVRSNGAYLVRRKESEQADGSESNGDVFDAQDDQSAYAISFRLVIFLMSLKLSE